MRRLVHSKYLFLTLLGLLLFIPQIVVPAPGRWSLQLGWPRVLAGDEPHYLVLIHSVLLDGDLDLKNNYASVHQGSDQAGRAYAGLPLDHHTLWYIDGRRVPWPDLFEVDAAAWQYDEQGHPRPTLRPGVAGAPAGLVDDLAGLPEYSSHPPGIALLLAPILFPFRHTAYVEPLAVLCSWLATSLAMVAFHALVEGLTSTTWLANAVTAVTFLGTPLWHYSRTLFGEPYLLLFALGAYVLLIRKGWPVIGGGLIAAGLLIKPPFLLLVVPLLVPLLWRKRWATAIGLVIPLVVAGGLVLWLNNTMFGAPLRAPQAYVVGNPLEGIGGLLFSPRHGILPFAPIALVALAAWPRFVREYPLEGPIYAGAFSLYFLLMAFWRDWTGGWCYGPRLVVPVLPFLLLPLTVVDRWPLYRKRWVKVALVSLGLLSISTNALGAIWHWKFWDQHPWVVLLGRLVPF